MRTHDFDDDDGPPQLVEADTLPDTALDVAQSADIRLDDSNIAKVPITIVTGMEPW